MTEKIDSEKITLAYAIAATRLILLDYDGTLVPLELYPEKAKPSTVLKSLIGELTRDPKNHVMIISGRSKENLEDFWNDVPVILAAEHGGFYKNPGNIWYSLFFISTDWIEEVYPAMKGLTFQYEGSLVEKKSYSLTWHYRAIADKITPRDKDQILTALRSLPDHKNFEICDDEFTIELRSPGIDKGSFVARWMGTKNYDFIMVIGDSKTDEDLFEVLDAPAYSIRIKESHASSAMYHLPDQTAVAPFLENLLTNRKKLEDTFLQTGFQRR